MSNADPIRKRYFDDVELADTATDWLFYVGAVLSVLSLLLDKSAYPRIYDWVQVGFLIDAVVLFVLGQVSRLYLTPRAEDKRRQDFFGRAFHVSLSHEVTDGYYNNDARDPNRKLAAQLLENSLFSKTIALSMARFERIKLLVYAVLWLICVINRQSDLGVILAASQVVFSEQLVSRWLRLEWLRMRFEKTYDDVYRLFQSRPAASTFAAMALDSLTSYEAAKSTAGITLSSGTFDKLNPSISNEWTSIKALLKL
ncbi:hypothetical protein [Burkholderia vietnamiensis]|uniref:hypothetical protein n=1 Tax=Burkholderia vietnamiensis TaxID=60552 RepID=UPI001B9AFD21|nr:hypothetical protein [Burkholderia vietnamiensis]MBR8219831.1 hypothetical protein [Burkholderia vietnamiensis]